jgi:hypothetical protein
MVKRPDWACVSVCRAYVARQNRIRDEDHSPHPDLGPMTASWTPPRRLPRGRGDTCGNSVIGKYLFSFASAAAGWQLR